MFITVCPVASFHRMEPFAKERDYTVPPAVLSKFFYTVPSTGRYESVPFCTFFIISLDSRPLLCFYPQKRGDESNGNHSMVRKQEPPLAATCPGNAPLASRLFEGSTAMGGNAKASRGFFSR
ncbi:MAG: hypothetical protein AVO39_03560 [delta proteobacterium MLS_D]|nr:MAG: hypothetical protein AVO39_03560 [delta proteobacterium MLS_D]